MDSAFYTIVAALIPIVWAAALKYINNANVQVHFYNNDECIMCVRNTSKKTLFIDCVEIRKDKKHRWPLL